MKLRKPETWENSALEALAILTLGGDWGKDPEFDSADHTATLCIRGSEFRNWNEDRGRTASLRKVKKTSLASRSLRIGDILVEISGGGPDQPVGRTVLIDKISLAHSPDLPKICTNFLRLFRPSQEIDSRYLNLFLQFFYKSGDIRAYQAGSNNLRNLKFDDYLGIEIPIPPFSEQHRIVSKIEELFSELDKGIENLKTAQSQLKVYRQALLKHTFEGNLTAQWRADNPDKLETADALLKRVQKEREQLYQQQLADWKNSGKTNGKPKAPKPVSALTAEELAELPLLPSGWAWSKLEPLAAQITDGEHFRPPTIQEGIPFLSAKDVRDDGVSFSTPLFINQETADTAWERCKPQRGDLLIVSRGATVGRMCVVNTDRPFCLLGSVILLKATTATIPSYLLAALKAPLVNKKIVGVSGATAQQAIYLRDIQHVPVPVCSLREQSEIVGMLEAKLSEVDQLDQTLVAAVQQSEALRQSILKKAFSGQLVPQNPTDEPAARLLERIRAEREKTGSTKSGRSR